MLIVAIFLDCLAALGMAGLALKYLRATPPVEYHARIMAADTVGPATKRVIGALYRVLAGALLALAGGVAIVALGGVMGDAFWAKLAVLIMIAGAGGTAVAVMRGVETETGVRTPWRPAAGLTGLGALGFVLALV
ncbi:hypothetical protein SAMN05444004_11542 [Jannaschia faecimaris]|uniref:DUF3784 domain-containing protein n=1 Tax=Jannaschia faecimaris TaxID=1244108 RepID=A0A1H3T6A4_9RHOB|nr:hypothetical protein [Jannaschia faecimaris]SDZ45744.1 hypothetical protein SAMN05444004_11542 [Jannaschia faecimaris]